MLDVKNRTADVLHSDIRQAILLKLAYLSAARTAADVIAGHCEEVCSPELMLSPFTIETREFVLLGFTYQRNAVFDVTVVRRMLMYQLTQPVPRRRCSSDDVIVA